MRVSLIAYTRFAVEPDVDWVPDDDNMTDADGIEYDGDALVEFAGRACYQSWNRPSPATASNEDYVCNLITVGHLSVLEHASATFYVTGVSRSLTHELVRHRHLSFSQLSQRFVDESTATYVIPPVLRGDPDRDELNDDQLLAEAMNYARTRYLDLVEQLTQHYGLARKQAREAARCVLPNMTETKIVVTGNYRAWRHFIDLRATPQADAEIRQLALAVLASLQGIAPSTFNDYRVVANADGVRYAESALKARDDG